MARFESRSGNGGVGVRQTGEVIHTISLVVWHRVAVDRPSEKAEERTERDKRSKRESIEDEIKREKETKRERRANETKVGKDSG